MSEPILPADWVPPRSVCGPNKCVNYVGLTYDTDTHHGVNMHQYADNPQLYLALEPSEYHLAVTRMDAWIWNISRWMCNNKHQLTDDKTEPIIISPARQTVKIEFNSIQGWCMCSESYTGIQPKPLVQPLTTPWVKQNTSLVKSCNYHLRSIGQAHHFLTHEVTEKVIHAFISSHLDNENSLLYGLPDYQMAQVQWVQRSLHWLSVDMWIKL